MSRPLQRGDIASASFGGVTNQFIVEQISDEIYVSARDNPTAISKLIHTPYGWQFFGTTTPFVIQFSIKPTPVATNEDIKYLRERKMQCIPVDHPWKIVSGDISEGVYEVCKGDDCSYTLSIVTFEEGESRRQKSRQEFEESIGRPIIDFWQCPDLPAIAIVTKKFPYIYAIIDMQTSYKFHYSEDEENFVEKILDDIRKAMRDGALIVVHELTPEDALRGGKTIPPIEDLLKEYNPQSIVTVDSRIRDKSDDIFRSLRTKAARLNTIRIVGVNADECILETTEGLIKKYDINSKDITIGPIYTFNGLEFNEHGISYMDAVDELQELGVNIDDSVLQQYDAYEEDLDEEDSETI